MSGSGLATSDPRASLPTRGTRASAVQTVPAEQFPIAGLNRSLLLPLPAAAAHTCPSNPATGYARAPNRYGCSARGDTSRPMNTSRAYQRVRGRRALHDHEQSDYRDKKISHCFLPFVCRGDVDHFTQRAIRAYAETDHWDCRARRLLAKMKSPPAKILRRRVLR